MTSQEYNKLNSDFLNYPRIDYPTVETIDHGHSYERVRFTVSGYAWNPSNKLRRKSFRLELYRCQLESLLDSLNRNEQILDIERDSHLITIEFPLTKAETETN